jgi:hypothetical protein
MSLLIENELIWVSIPKCASTSIEYAFLNSDLNITQSQNARINKFHTHVPLFALYKEFGTKETICIKRDWFNRWLSGFEYIYEHIKFVNELFKAEVVTPKVKWEDIDNSFIFNTFTEEFCNKLNYVEKKEDIESCYSHFATINDKNNEKEILSYTAGNVHVLLSQNHWKNNNKCTYEFDIQNLNDFEFFIEKRFGKKIKINKLNTTQKIPNKIIINDELKNFVWNKFEKQFQKNKNLL